MFHKLDDESHVWSSICRKFHIFKSSHPLKWNSWKNRPRDDLKSTQVKGPTCETSSVPHSLQRCGNKPIRCHHVTCGLTLCLTLKHHLSVHRHRTQTSLDRIHIMREPAFRFQSRPGSILNLFCTVHHLWWDTWAANYNRKWNKQKKQHFTDNTHLSNPHADSELRSERRGASTR